MLNKIVIYATDGINDYSMTCKNTTGCLRLKKNYTQYSTTTYYHALFPNPHLLPPTHPSQGLLAASPL